MKKNQVNEILVDQVKRRRIIISYVCVLLVVFFISLSLFIFLVGKNKTYYVNYKEKSNLDYQVYLKENDFFKVDSLTSDKQYIASLIDYIKASFDYSLEVDDDDFDYGYQYRIEAEVLVKDEDTNNNLYQFNETLIEKNISYPEDNFVNINEDITINYNKYNDLIKKFVNVYDLDEAISTLNVNMYVDISGNCDYVEDSDRESVISLSIPLTTNTVAIDMSYDLAPSDTKMIECRKNNSNNTLFIIVEIIFVGTLILVLVKMIKYIIDTRSAETIYERNLKKILNNYKSYIQKVSNELDLSEYQVLKLDTFTDMLEIRDTIQAPILMVQNKEKQSTYFFIPSSTKVIYLYGLRVVDIKKQQQNNK